MPRRTQKQQSSKRSIESFPLAEYAYGIEVDEVTAAEIDHAEVDEVTTAVGDRVLAPEASQNITEKVRDREADPPSCLTQQSPPSTSSSPRRQLKVEDALAYLDQIKETFVRQPSVYNDFLDIMKEFKAERVDTPGVINRVFRLFRGHRELVLGFNTFLPPGYKIEFSDDEDEPRVQLTCPSPSPPLPSPPPPLAPPPPPASSPWVRVDMPDGRPYWYHQATRETTWVDPEAPSGPPPPPPVQNSVVLSGMTGPQPSGFATMNAQHTTPRATAPPQPPPPQTLEPRPSLAARPSSPRRPIEFDEAVDYVKKVKTRFAKQPEKYKAFLEILHTYQKERKPLKEVYGQVASLFKDHNDLLGGFSVFLPDGACVSPKMARWRLVGRMVGPLMLAWRRASQRVYAPGGAGFEECRHEFVALSGGAAGDGVVDDDVINKFEIGDTVILHNGSLCYEAEVLQVEPSNSPSGRKPAVGRKKDGDLGSAFSYLIRYTKWPRRAEEWVAEAFVYAWSDVLAKGATNRPPRNLMWVEQKGAPKTGPMDDMGEAEEEAKQDGAA